MSAAQWVIAGIILAAVLGTAALRAAWNRDRARWARDRWPIVHPGESDTEQPDHGVSGDTIARVRCWQRSLDSARGKTAGDGEWDG